MPLAVVEGTTVPQLGEHAVPFCVTAQVLPLLSGSKPTVAVNCWVMLTGSSTLLGVTETVMEGTDIATEDEA